MEVVTAGIRTKYFLLVNQCTQLRHLFRIFEMFSIVGGECQFLTDQFINNNQVLIL